MRENLQERFFSPPPNVGILQYCRRFNIRHILRHIPKLGKSQILRNYPGGQLQYMFHHVSSKQSCVFVEQELERCLKFALLVPSTTGRLSLTQVPMSALKPSAKPQSIGLCGFHKEGIARGAELGAPSSTAHLRDQKTWARSFPAAFASLGGIVGCF